MNDKKALQALYNERIIIGGVYAIKNIHNNKLLIEAATDLNGSKNRFGFAQKTGSCVHMKLQKDWAEQGGGAFDFQVLEELEKGKAQSDSEFKAEIELLKQMWLEKLSGEDFY